MHYARSFRTRALLLVATQGVALGWYEMPGWSISRSFVETLLVFDRGGAIAASAAKSSIQPRLHRRYVTGEVAGDAAGGPNETADGLRHFVRHAGPATRPEEKRAA